MNSWAVLGVLLIVTQVVLVVFGFTDDSRVSERSIIASYLIGLLVSFIVGAYLILGAGR